MTQDDVAKATQLAEVTVRRFERADETVSMPNRAAIAEAVGCEFDWKELRVIPPKGMPADAIEWAVRELQKRRGRARVDAPVRAPSKTALDIDGRPLSPAPDPEVKPK